MASIIQSLGDVIRSVFELLGSIVQTVFDLVKGVFQGIFKSIEFVISSLLDLLNGAIKAVGGVGKFIIGMSLMSRYDSTALIIRQATFSF